MLAHYEYSTDFTMEEYVSLKTLEDEVRNQMSLRINYTSPSYGDYINSIDKGDVPSSVDSDVRAEMKKRERERLLKEKMVIIESFGTDTFANGTVLKVSKKFEEGGTTYDYAAIKANGKWYTTAVNSSVFTWEEFLAWLVSGKFPATGFTRMVPAG